MQGDISIVNCTGHDIYLLPPDDVSIPTPVKMSEIQKFLGRCKLITSTGHAKIEIFREQEQIKYKGVKFQINYSNMGAINGLPDKKDGTIIIVSQLVMNALVHTRKDVFIMDNNIKDERGKVIACKSFSRSVYKEHSKPLQAIIDILAKTVKHVPFYQDVIESMVSLEKYMEK